MVELRSKFKYVSLWNTNIFFWSILSLHAWWFYLRKNYKFQGKIDTLRRTAEKGLSVVNHPELNSRPHTCPHVCESRITRPASLASQFASTQDCLHSFWLRCQWGIIIKSGLSPYGQNNMMVNSAICIWKYLLKVHMYIHGPSNVSGLCTTSKDGVKTWMCVCLLSRVWPFATPWTVVCQAPLSMEFSWQKS